MVSEKKRAEDEKLREKLKHVDLNVLKKAIKPLVRPDDAKAKGKDK